MASMKIQPSEQMIEHIPREIVFPTREAAALVGSTPIARYASWADHRSAIRRSADDARVGVLARRAA